MGSKVSLLLHNIVNLNWMEDIFGKIAILTNIGFQGISVTVTVYCEEQHLFSIIAIILL